MPSRVSKSTKSTKAKPAPVRPTRLAAPKSASPRPHYGAKSFSQKRIMRSILTEARVLNRHMGAAELIADKVAAKVAVWAASRAEITEDDLNRQVAKELRRYDSDLAYVYQNRGKII